MHLFGDCGSPKVYLRCICGAIEGQWRRSAVVMHIAGMCWLLNGVHTRIIYATNDNLNDVYLNIVSSFVSFIAAFRRSVVSIHVSVKQACFRASSNDTSAFVPFDSLCVDMVCFTWFCEIWWMFRM